METNLQQFTDKAGYELLLKTKPGVIEAINAALKKGATAKQIERGLIRRFRGQSLTAQLAIGAAYHLESQQISDEQKPGN